MYSLHSKYRYFSKKEEKIRIKYQRTDYENNAIYYHFHVKAIAAIYLEASLNAPYHSHYRGKQRHALLETFCKLDISGAVAGWNVDNRTCYLICISVSLQMEITRAYPIFQGTLQHVTEFRKIITLLRDAEFPRADSLQTITTFPLSLSLSLSFVSFLSTVIALRTVCFTEDAKGL